MFACGGLRPLAGLAPPKQKILEPPLVWARMGLAPQILKKEGFSTLKFFKVKVDSFAISQVARL